MLRKDQCINYFVYACVRVCMDVCFSLFCFRGMWFDSQHGNLLKVDPEGCILQCVHGFHFLKS